MNKDNYEEFLESKRQLIGNFGFKAIYIPDIAFDHQKYTIEKAILRGKDAQKRFENKSNQLSFL